MCVRTASLSLNSEPHSRQYTASVSPCLIRLKKIKGSDSSSMSGRMAECVQHPLPPNLEGSAARSEKEHKKIPLPKRPEEGLVIELSCQPALVSQSASPQARPEISRNWRAYGQSQARRLSSPCTCLSCKRGQPYHTDAGRNSRDARTMSRERLQCKPDESQSRC